jgi:PAS domain S-box-containing protein
MEAEVQEHVTGRRQRLRVLVVEDDAATRRAVAKVLYSGEYADDEQVEVVEIADGAHALAVLGAAPGGADGPDTFDVQPDRAFDRGFDCAFIDYHLPGHNGLEVLRALRRAGRDTPVIIMTAVGDEELAVEVMKAGATDYLPKSRLSPDRVMQSLRHARRVHRAEQAVRDSERKFRALFDGALDAILIADDTGRYVDANPAACALVGLSREQLLGMCVADLVGPGPDVAAGADGGRVTTAVAWQEFLRRGEAKGWVRLRHAAGGADREVEFSARANFMPGHHLSVLRDITERRRAEEALRQTNERFRALVNASPVAVLVVDARGVVLVWNPAAERTLGWPAAEVLGRPLPVSGGAGGDDEQSRARRKAELTGVLHRVLAGETLTGFELRCPRKDGGAVDACVSAGPLMDAGGRVSGVVAVVADVTQDKRLREQLAHAQRMESVGRLAGGVAHDFNNLLAVIAGYSEALLRHVPAGHALRGHVEEIEKAAERGASLTRQLLAFSRRQAITPQPIDLGAVVAGVRHMLLSILGDRVEIAVRQPDARVGRVLADRGQMEQVLVNLALNARDAMPDGGSLSIDTREFVAEAVGGGGTDSPEAKRAAGGPRPGRYVRLSVSDTGHGMDPDTQARIFEPFFTTKGGKGTGLGLSIVYGIVEQAGGHIAVQSRPGEGTTFEVYLPVVPEDSAVA